MLQFVGINKSYRVRMGNFLRPKYRIVQAVKDVNLTVGDNETVAILGPNGAGKSTLCKIAAGMTKPSSGQATLNGVDITQNVREISRKIGAVLGPTLIYHRLSGYQYLKYFAKIFAVRNYDEKIHLTCRSLGIEKLLDSFIESYSLGTKMKISLARALLHDPELLVLDEFTMGLDPISAKEVRHLVKGAKRTILLTTHNTLDAQTMADRVAFFSRGKMVIVDAIRNLNRIIQDRVMVVATVAEPDGLRKALSELESVNFHESENGQFEILIHGEQLTVVLKVLTGHALLRVETREPSLEEAYRYFTGDTLVEQ